ncbi:hypothetical protein Q5752_005113 [Cryptotrichosporon argae]
MHPSPLAVAAVVLLAALADCRTVPLRRQALDSNSSAEVASSAISPASLSLTLSDVAAASSLSGLRRCIDNHYHQQYLCDCSAVVGDNDIVERNLRHVERSIFRDVISIDAFKLASICAAQLLNLIFAGLYRYLRQRGQRGQRAVQRISGGFVFSCPGVVTRADTVIERRGKRCHDQRSRDRWL